MQIQLTLHFKSELRYKIYQCTVKRCLRVTRNFTSFAYLSACNIAIYKQENAKHNKLLLKVKTPKIKRNFLCSF